MEQKITFITEIPKLRKGAMAGLCRQFGISRKTGYKWLKRFRNEGEAGFRDRSSRPIGWREATSLASSSRP